MAGHQQALVIHRRFLAILQTIVKGEERNNEPEGNKIKMRKYQVVVNANRHESHYFYLIPELWLASAADVSNLRMTMGQFESLL